MQLEAVNITVFWALGIIVTLFVFWHEMRRDGFDEERAFDLFLVSLISAIVAGRFIEGMFMGYRSAFLLMHVARFWTPGINLIAFILVFLLPVYVFPKLWRWSFFRVSDIYVTSFSLGLSIIFLGIALDRSNVSFLAYSFVYFVLFSALYRIRLGFRSGMAYSLFLVSNVFVGLKIYLLLFTMGVVNLYLRERKNPMKSNLPASFITKIKKTLTKKEKDLEAEQKLLIEEDPYISPGRDSDNEYLDDVAEDIGKTETDLRLSAVNDLTIKVKKALAKIKLGKYGICDVCGKPIGIDRLRAYPEATTCVEHSS